MNTKKLLFCTGEGVGNTVQILPCLRTLKELLGYDTTLWHAFGSFPISDNLIPYASKTLIGSNIRNINISDYVGMVSTFWTRGHISGIPLPLLNDIKAQEIRMDVSEVDVYLNIARDLGAAENDLKWYGECNVNSIDKSFDVVLNDGCNRNSPAMWEIKSYPRYKELANIIVNHGLSVCSIGTSNEYIEGTVNMTGLPLLSSIGLIKNSNLLISNDSGMYHCANAVGTKNIVIFTATSIKKNYDKRFHKYSSIITNGISCQPCQANRRWAKDCTDWKCRDIDPNYIATMALSQV